MTLPNQVVGTFPPLPVPVVANKGFNLDSQSFVPGKKQATPAPAPTAIVVEDPVQKAVEKAGIKASDDDMKKLKELIARLNSAKGEEKANALKDVQNISSIVKSKPQANTYWSAAISREPTLIKLEKSSFSKGSSHPK